MTRESIAAGLDQLTSDILRICSRLLESTDLSIDDDFFDKGGDSLLATELMLELRQLTGKALPDSLLFESSTVRALAQRLSEKETPRFKPAVRVGASSDGAMPLLFFHGDWSWGGFYVEHLARGLGREISLIAVSPHGPGGEPIPPSIEEMAADRLASILEVQPTGPYRLAGHCIGGIVAFETARLLTNLNHRVDTVVMIDSPVMRGGEALKSPRWAPGVGHAGAGDQAPDDIPIRPATPFGEAFERYTERLLAYSPAPFPVRLLVLASEYDGRDWIRLSEDAKLLEIPGDHFDLVTHRINELASRLRSWLSGDISAGLGESHPPAGAEGHEFSRARVRNRESEEFQTPQIGPSNSLSRRLRSFLDYARR